MEDKTLNKEQLTAVKHKKGPLLIIAGAGTGKTTVITKRIEYLITNKVAEASEILALTFTEKAAQEMEERVDVCMPYGYTQMWISTFHSFCDRVLRAEALDMGMDPRYKLMTESETIQFIRNNLFKFDLDYFRPLGNPTRFVGGILRHFSRLQDENITHSEYLCWAKSKNKSEIENQKWLELAKAFSTYGEIKNKEGMVDFGDLIVKTLTLFQERPNILRKYKKKFKYILVDEFQDTNIAQNDLVMILAGKQGNVTVVADDDQSIYKWRGAAVSNVLQFRKNYPKAKLVTLTKNYRSSQEILDRAYQLIKFNNPDRLEVVEKIDKKLKSATKKKRSKIELINTDRAENEAEKVVEKVRSLVSEEGFKWGDMAILVRANNHSDPFIRALQRSGVPYQFLGPGRLFRQSEIIDLISYLKVLRNFEDNVSVYRLLSIEHFAIPAKDLIRINNYAKRFNLGLFDALGKVEDIYINPESKDKIKYITRIIEKHIELGKKETAGQLLYFFLGETKLLEKLLNPDSPEAEKRVKNISRFFDKLKAYETDHEDASAGAVVEWIELATELGESPLISDTDWIKTDAVNILTVHSSKGLEFPVVFLVNLVNQRFPTTERREQIPIPDELVKEVLPKGDYHQQEERRLFYVGMTRAMERLYFSASDYYGEGKQRKKLSPFIFEALGDKFTPEKKTKESGEQLSFLNYDPYILKIKDDTPDEKIKIDFLSYSQIQTFSICPLHYKLKYILKVPTPPNSALSFGLSMHATMRDFYSRVKSQSKPTEKLMYDLLTANWVAEGYMSKNHEKEMFKKGKRYLKKYLENVFDRKNLPIMLEQPFVIPLRSNENRNERPIKVGGKIDRIDALKGGGIEIIDYKTGEKVPVQKEVDRELQLTFYALAATRIKEGPFNKNPESVKLSLYFFKEQTKISTEKTERQLNAAIKDVFEWRKKIEGSDFKCSDHFLCQNNCEYSLMCNADRNK